MPTKEKRNKEISIKLFKKILVIVFLVILITLLLITRDRITWMAKNDLQSPVQDIMQKGVGERIVYAVKMGKLTVGESVYIQLKNEQLNGKQVMVMIFKTKVANFSDTEKIYADPSNYLPLRIERDINNLFIKEKIVEEYNQEKFTVDITKVKFGFRNIIQIKKDSPINNAILLPQYVRFAEKFNHTQNITANLPTRSYIIRFAAEEEISLPGGNFKTYHYESTPKQIDIWISADERKIPVKIEGNNLFGYSMELKEYNPS